MGFILCSTCTCSVYVFCKIINNTKKRFFLRDHQKCKNWLRYVNILLTNIPQDKIITTKGTQPVQILYSLDCYLVHCLLKYKCFKRFVWLFGILCNDNVSIDHFGWRN